MKWIRIISTWKLHITHRILIWSRHCDTSLTIGMPIILLAIAVPAFHSMSGLPSLMREMPAKLKLAHGFEWKFCSYMSIWKIKRTKLANLNCKRLYAALSKLYCFFLLCIWKLKEKYKKRIGCRHAWRLSRLILFRYMRVLKCI